MSSSRKLLAEFGLGLIIGGSIFTANYVTFAVPFVDEKITMQMLERFNAVEILTVLPVVQPHYPTWYLVPELLGVQAGYTLSMLSLLVSSLFAMLAARELYGSYQSQYLAAGLVTFSPFMAAQAGWLRMYAPLSAITAVTVYFYVMNRRRSMSVSSLLAAAVHPFGAIIAFWSALKLWFDDCHRLAVATATTPLLFLALYLAANIAEILTAEPKRMSVKHIISHQPVTTPTLLEAFIAPVSSLTASPITAPHIVLIVLVSLLVLVMNPRRDILLLIVLYVGGITIASHLIFPVFRLKSMAGMSPAVAVLIANDDRPTYIQAVIVAGMALLYFVGWVYRYQRSHNIRQYVFDTGLSFDWLVILLLITPILLFVVGLWALRDGPVS